MLEWLFVIHVAATWFMVGVIWFVQIVHYPLYGSVGTAEFEGYEKRHQLKTAWVVFPAMFVELGSLLFLMSRPSPLSSDPLLVVSFLFLLIIWLSTGFIQMPAHQKLTMGADPEVLKKLVRWNWIRTIFWSLRGLLLVYLLMNRSF